MVGRGIVPLEHIRYLLFDLDGTLIDTTALILQTFRETFRELGIPIRPDAELLSQVGRPLRLQMRDVDATREQQLVDLYSRLYDEFHDGLAREFPGIGKVLAELKERDYPLAIVTSKRSRVVEQELRYFDLADLFDTVIAADDTDRNKPHPEPLLEAVRRLGGRPGEATYIGDSPFDLRSAHAAGMLAGAVEWSPFPRASLEEETPDYWIPTPESLLQLFPGRGARNV